MERVMTAWGVVEVTVTCPECGTENRFGVKPSAPPGESVPCSQNFTGCLNADIAPMSLCGHSFTVADLLG